VNYYLKYNLEAGNTRENLLLHMLYMLLLHVVKFVVVALGKKSIVVAPSTKSVVAHVILDAIAPIAIFVVVDAAFVIAS
jgi:hypothetical protein